MTTFEYSLLGLVALQPQSGYDLKTLLAETPMGQFSPSPGAIYPALRRLEARGLLESRIDGSVSATRPRRIFTVTEKGKTTLVEWLRTPVSRDELERQPGSAILRFSLAEPWLSTAEIVSYLEGYRCALEAYCAEVEEHRRSFGSLPARHPALALEHGLRMLESQSQWATDAIAALMQSDSDNEGNREPKPQQEDKSC